MVKIQDLRVYDPMRDGLDFVTYNKLYSVVSSVSAVAANAMFDGIQAKVEESPIRDGQTLREFLYGSEGFFPAHRDIRAVLFMNGRFLADYTDEGWKHLSLEEVAIKSNAIPFLFFSLPSQVEAYLQQFAIADQNSSVKLLGKQELRRSSNRSELY